MKKMSKYVLGNAKICTNICTKYYFKINIILNYIFYILF